MSQFKDSEMICSGAETKSFEKHLKTIIKERYEASFDKSKLTPAAEMHEKVKHLLGLETHVA